MIKKIKKVFYGVTSVGVLAMPLLVSAQIKPLPTNTGLPTATGQNAFAEILTKVLNFFLAFIGVLAILMIVVAGVMYITSGGDEGRVEKAKNWLIYAIVGLIVALLGWIIVKTVGSALGANF